MTGLTSTDTTTDTPTPTGQNAGDVLRRGLKQNENQYNELVAKGDTEGAKAKAREGAILLTQALLVTENQALLKDAMKVAPNLVKSIAEELKAGGVKAFQEMIMLQSAANKLKQDMYRDEIDKMYHARLSTADGPAKFLSGIKGFALLLQSFGFDCTDFIKECDKNIEAEYAKVPKKDIDGMNKGNFFTVDPNQPAKAIDDMAKRALGIISSIPQTIDTSTTDAAQGALRTLNGGTGKAAPQQPATASGPQAAATPMEPVETKYVTSALQTLLEEKKLITGGKMTASVKADLQNGVQAAAGLDGNGKTLSSQDVDALALNTQDFLSKNGTKVDAAKAAEITRLAIEKAKGLALAGPSPQPA